MLWMFVLGSCRCSFVLDNIWEEIGASLSLSFLLQLLHLSMELVQGKVEAKIVIFVIAAVALSSVNKNANKSYCIFAGFLQDKIFWIMFCAICGLAVALKSLK